MDILVREIAKDGWRCGSLTKVGAMGGNKSYYLSESGLIHRAVRALRTLPEAQGIYLR